MKVKICGITLLEDALAAVAAGADMLGFNFYPKSPRFLEIDDCARIVRELRHRSRKVVMVGVFVNSSVEMVELAMKKCDLDLAQLSGDETPAMVQSLGEKAYKALRSANFKQLIQYVDSYTCRTTPPAVLIDANLPGAYGGTGKVADWSLVEKIATRYAVLLAGGLTPENVTAAVSQAKPWGVDVASGIESAPGRKDTARMAAFIQAAHSAV